MSTSIFSQEIRRANERQQRRIESLSRLKAPFADPSLGMWAACQCILYTYGKLLISVFYIGDGAMSRHRKLFSVQVASPRIRFFKIEKIK